MRFLFYNRKDAAKPTCVINHRTADYNGWYNANNMTIVPSDDRSGISTYAQKHGTVNSYDNVATKTHSVIMQQLLGADSFR